MQTQRRTQSQRRESTIAKLRDATIAVLSSEGYARTTVAMVCKRAGVSQGALFGHFKSRVELIASATEEVCRRHLELISGRLSAVAPAGDGDSVEQLIRAIRDASRTDEHAAWHEVMVAARTDLQLRSLVSPALKGFEQRLLEVFGAIAGPAGHKRLGTIMLSLLHLFDSESVTVAVYGNPQLEEDRVQLLVELLRHEMGTGAKSS